MNTYKKTATLQILIDRPTLKKLKILKIKCNSKNWTEFLRKVAQDFKVTK